MMGMLKITRKIFGMKNANEMDFTVLAAMAKNPYPASLWQSGAIRTDRIRIPMLIDDLGLTDNKNVGRYANRIERSIRKLEEGGVITVNHIKGDVFEVYQNVDLTGRNQGYFTFDISDYYKIIDSLSTAEALKAMACYLAICNKVQYLNMDDVNVKELADEDLTRRLNFENLETIGGYYSKARRSVSNSIKELSKLEIIYGITIKGKDNNVFMHKNYYTLHRYSAVLNEFVARTKMRKVKSF